ncbi:hypothetical protein [Thermomonas sp.]|uniref:DUF7009 family protein n=1 Tax=Thermomonas sp. TaxID=1971895 RepID=UPI001D90C014|nr:hypothetical protein [Thermomonas sp.]MBZ0087194.1 hypothetical protein [Thermomonas sp.]HRO62554.1 hypothetical protein [Thermomonas sp.]
MKVQLQGQSLRLRIDEAELARLRDGEEIANHTALPGQCGCTQRVALTDAAQAEFSGGPDDWRLLLPHAQVEDYVKRLPCKDGLHYALPASAGQTLTIDFEVDVRDSARLRGKAKR